MSAGIIIGSVAGELFPLLGLASYIEAIVSDIHVSFYFNALGLEDEKSWQNNFALFSGFVLAIGIMFGLDKLLDICEDDDDEDEDEEDNEKGPLAKYIGTNGMQEALLAGEDNSTSVEANKISMWA